MTFIRELCCVPTPNLLFPLAHIRYIIARTPTPACLSALGSAHARSHEIAKVVDGSSSHDGRWGAHSVGSRALGFGRELVRLASFAKRG